MFQITHHKSQHDLRSGSDDIDGLILPFGTVKYYLAVTLEGPQPQTMDPTVYLTTDKLGGRGAEDVFPVYHYPASRTGLFQLFEKLNI